MKLVYEWLPTVKFIIFGTRFRTESTHEKELMDALTLTENDLRKAEMGYHGKFRHIFRQIQHIALMSGMAFFTQPVV